MEIKEPVEEKTKVLPLVIPNNFDYDADNGILVKNPNIERTTLKVYQPALDFIETIGRRVGTITIAGRARTGKSLIAGELVSPGEIPCPFDLGHTMDACTYGIWVALKPIQFDKLSLLVFDVEGTGFHESVKQHDMQLMVCALLISSYFVYNTKGTFDGTAMDELKFVLQLGDRIKSYDETGSDFSKFFPKFLWLLRDSHLVPMLNGNPCSPKEYFNNKVLRLKTGNKQQLLERNSIRQIFVQMFSSIDAFTLPIPHSNEEKLGKLGEIPRSELEENFIEDLEMLCDKVLEETPAKQIYSKKGGVDHFTPCTGVTLSEYIKNCVQAVNDPNKVPHIGSIGAAVMEKSYSKIKDVCVKLYRKRMKAGINAYRGRFGGAQKVIVPMETKQLVDLHIEVLGSVLKEEGRELHCVLKEEKGGELDEVKHRVLQEFYLTIGHSPAVGKIGETGFMKDLMLANAQQSKKYCCDFLERRFESDIEPMLNEPGAHVAAEVMQQFQQLEKAYFDYAVGPAKNEVWGTFVTDKRENSMKQFQKMRLFEGKLVEAEEKEMRMREKHRRLGEEVSQMKHILQQQKGMMAREMEMLRAQKIDQEKEHDKMVKEMKETIEDMKQAGMHNLQVLTKEMLEEMRAQQEIQQRNSEHQLKKMQDTMDVLVNKPPVLPPKGPTCPIL